MDIVKTFQLHFNVDMLSILLANLARTFNIKFSASNNIIYNKS